MAHNNFNMNINKKMQGKDPANEYEYSDELMDKLMLLHDVLRWDTAKFIELAKKEGFYCFPLVNNQGNMEMVIIKQINECKVQVVQPVALFPIFLDSINSTYEEPIQSLKNELKKDKDVWIPYIVTLLPNHFFEFMDTHIRVHKKYLKSTVLKDYLARGHVDTYKDGHFTTMINDYAVFKGYSLVWSKGKIWFTLNKYKQIIIIF